MSEDYYYLKDIVFALRNEYLRIQSELDKLEGVIIPTNPKYLNGRFTINNDGGYDNNHILITLYERQRKISSILKSISGYIDQDEHKKKIRLNDKLCNPLKDIEPLSMGTKSSLLTLLSDPFISDTPSTELLCYPYLAHFDLGPNHIKVLSRMITGNPGFLFMYDAFDDNISFITREYHSQELLNSILHIRINRDIISSYHQEIIDKSPTLGKEVVIASPIRRRISNFGGNTLSIQETEKQIILQKK